MSIGGIRGAPSPDALRDHAQDERIEKIERRISSAPAPEHDRRQPADAHDMLQDAQMSRLLVSVGTLTDQMAEITVAQHRAARDLADRGHEISEIRETVKRNAETAKEVFELFDTLKGGFRVLGWLGVFAKGVAGIAAAGLAIWAAWEKVKGGK